MSVDYYVRLEQGRTNNVSEEVLGAVAQALRLDDTERGYLFALAKPVKTARRPPRQEKVRPALQRLLDMAGGVPAYIIGRRGDILAWNRLAAALFADFGAIPPGERNWARMIFLDEEVRRRFADWTVKGRETTAFLRLKAGEYPGDKELCALIGELTVKSEDFRHWWADYNVREKTFGRQTLDHPLVGEMTFEYEALRPAGESEQILAMYTVEAGSVSEERLNLLASWALASA